MTDNQGFKCFFVECFFRFVQKVAYFLVYFYFLKTEIIYFSILKNKDIVEYYSE